MTTDTQSTVLPDHPYYLAFTAATPPLEAAIRFAEKYGRPPDELRPASGGILVAGPLADHEVRGARAKETRRA